MCDRIAVIANGALVGIVENVDDARTGRPPDDRSRGMSIDTEAHGSATALDATSAAARAATSLHGC